REACEAYIKSQASLGWKLLPQHYDDAAYSGGNLERPALKRLLREIQLGRIDVVVVYKIDRLTRSADGFCRVSRDLRCPLCVLRGRDPAVQYDDIDGAIDPQHPPLLCPVRTRAGIGASEGQDCGVSQKGKMDRRHGSPRL